MPYIHKNMVKKHGTSLLSSYHGIALVHYAAEVVLGLFNPMLCTPSSPCQDVLVHRKGIKPLIQVTLSIQEMSYKPDKTVALKTR